MQHTLSTFSSHHTSSSINMTVKPCEANGQPSCNKGFVREKCRKCDLGSIQCEMCHPSRHRHRQPTQSTSPRTSFSMDGKQQQQRARHGNSSSTLLHASSSSHTSPDNSPTAASAPVPPCIFCFHGRNPCDECFGLGYVQRVCQECLKDQHRRNQRKRRSTGSSYVYNSTHHQGGHFRQLSRDSIPSTMPSILTSQQWKRWFGFGSSSPVWRPTRQESKSCSALDLDQQQREQHKAARRHSSVSSASTMSLPCSASTTISTSSCPPQSPQSSQERFSEDLTKLDDSSVQPELEQQQQIPANKKAWKRWMSTFKTKARPVLPKVQTHRLAAPLMSAA